ncbi:rCG21462 [Rattus norvegicus]|uniref:RCG21462 n=1 Tax=Rattus norvegicus TaxID=10116 RepID=A6J0T3_RAT|nr:rCG21462 [Rattus norvegicus]
MAATGKNVWNLGWNPWAAMRPHFGSIGVCKRNSVPCHRTSWRSFSCRISPGMATSECVFDEHLLSLGSPCFLGLYYMALLWTARPLWSTVESGSRNGGPRSTPGKCLLSHPRHAGTPSLTNSLCT